jgi:glycosyltransferase involved in cell wall biosynthesis
VPETITHVSFSSAGGAGSVARILSDEQRRRGQDSQLVSVITSDLRKSPLSTPLHTMAAGIDEYIVKAADFSSPISVLRDQVNGLRIRDIAGVDIIHLHGINGAMRLEDLHSVPKHTRVVWTLHDMNPFTGACHYSLGCEGFKSSCSGCPAVKSVFYKSVSDLLTTKKEAVAKVPNLSVVSPSRWLAEEAKHSTVFASHSISVVPNPIDPIFLGENSASTKTDETISLRIIVVAKNLSDPVKQVDTAVRAFRSAFPNKGNATLTLVGSGGKEFEGEGVTLTGPLAKSDLAQAFAQSDVLIVPSKGENAPLVIGEAAASGCLPLVASVGGMGEMVSALQHGSVFEHTEELIHHLTALRQVSVATKRELRAAIRRNAVLLYSPSAAATEYDKVYSS